MLKRSDVSLTFFRLILVGAHVQKAGCSDGSTLAPQEPSCSDYVGHCGTVVYRVLQARVGRYSSPGKGRVVCHRLELLCRCLSTELF